LIYQENTVGRYRVVVNKEESFISQVGDRLKEMLRVEPGQVTPASTSVYRGKEPKENLQTQLREMGQQLENVRREKQQQEENSQRQLRKMEQRLARMEQQLREQGRILSEKEFQEGILHKQLRERDQQEENLQRQLREMEQQLARMEQQLRKKGKAIERKGTAIDNFPRSIERKRGSRGHLT